MKEITRFRIVRAPKKLETMDIRVTRYPGPDDKSRIESSPLDSLEDWMQQIVVRPTAIQQRNLFIRTLRSLNRWLESKNFKFSAAELRDRIVDWVIAARTDAPNNPVEAEATAEVLVEMNEWALMRTSVGDSILLQTYTHESVKDLQILCSWFLVIKFIERIVGLSEAEIDALDKKQYLLHRIILIPPQFIRYKTPFLGSGSIMARQPAFTDFTVVREEWSCYRLGEIAHIENVLRGESKTRTHTRTDETRTELSEELERTQLDELDTQSTDRASFQEEVSRQTQLEIGVEAQVNVNANYGPVQIETNVGASVNYSSDEAHRRANEMAHEVVSRSLNRIEERVSKKRASVTINRIVETNRHQINNSVSPTGHVVGIYRWVDKISRLQVFTYPHRFVLEFQIPEPAAYIRWTEHLKPEIEVNVEEPPKFSLSEESEQSLSPSDINRENYRDLVARFKASGQLPPPDQEIHVSNGAEISNVDKLPESVGTTLEFPPTASVAIEFVVPTGYKVTKAKFSFSGVPILGFWRDQEVQDKDSDPHEIYYLEKHLGYHAIIAGVTFGGQQSVIPIDDSDKPTVIQNQPTPSGGKPSGYRSRQAWLEATTELQDDSGMGSDKVNAAVVVTAALRCVISADLTCTLTDTTFQEWQLETFDRLREAHTAWERRYKEAVNAKEIDQGIEISGRSPGANRLTVHEEIKRQVIEMMLGHRFDGLDLVHISPEESESEIGPVTSLREAADTASMIQFIEQVFEWSNMTYIFYPYYWTDRTKWPDLIRLEGADPAYAEFLRSGSARVIVPARPGFETDVLVFTEQGIPWGGGPIPLADDEERYISVAQEIQDMRGVGDQGIPGNLWEVKQPTTLVWLDNDSSLPKHNESRRLTGTPLIDLCSGTDR